MFTYRTDAINLLFDAIRKATLVITALMLMIMVYPDGEKVYTTGKGAKKASPQGSNS